MVTTKKKKAPKRNASRVAQLPVKLSPGEMVRTLRGLQEMTQAALAKSAGLTQAAISAIESGSEQLGPERARRLARALRVHPAVVMFPDWEPSELEGAAE